MEYLHNAMNCISMYELTLKCDHHTYKRYTQYRNKKQMGFKGRHIPLTVITVDRRSNKRDNMWRTP